MQAPTGSVYLNAGTTPTIPSGAVWKDVVFVNTMATLTVHGAIALSKVVEVELNATTSFTIPLGGSITGLGSTLVVRASSANVAGSVVALMLKWYGEALSIAATGSVSGDSMSVTTDMPGTPTGLFCGGWHAGTAPCPTVRFIPNTHRAKCTHTSTRVVNSRSITLLLSPIGPMARWLVTKRTRNHIR